MLNRAGCSSVENTTPYEIWFNKKFNLSFLKEFGSNVSVHVVKRKRRKLDSKNERGLLVGYSETTKGYRVYLPERDVVEIHRDVVFIPENEKNIELEKPQKEKVVVLDLQKEEEPQNKKTNENEIRNPEIDNSSLDHTRDHSSESENENFERASESHESESENSSTSEEGSTQNSTERQGKRSIKAPVWIKDYDMSADMCFYSQEEEPLNYKKVQFRSGRVQAVGTEDNINPELLEHTRNSKLPLPGRYGNDNKSVEENKSYELSSKFDCYNDSEKSDEESEERASNANSDDDSPLKLKRSDRLEALMQELNGEIQGRPKAKEKTAKVKTKAKRKRKRKKRGRNQRLRIKLMGIKHKMDQKCNEVQKSKRKQQKVETFGY